RPTPGGACRRSTTITALSADKASGSRGGMFGSTIMTTSTANKELNMLNRRQFLQGSTAIAATTSLPFVAPRVVRAIPPIPRNGQPKFKFSLAAYSYRDLLLPKQG